MDKHIGEIIRERRKKMGLTQENLAIKLGVSRTTVASWEQQKNYPDMKLMIAISRLLNISLEELLDQEKADELKQSEKYNKQKLNKRKKYIVRIIMIVFIVFSCFGMYKSLEVQDIYNLNYIESIEVKNDILYVKADLPFYKSLGDGVLTTTENKNIAKLSLSIYLDLNHEEEMKIELKDWLKENNTKEVYIVSGDRILKKVKIDR